MRECPVALRLPGTLQTPQQSRRVAGVNPFLGD